MGGWVEKKKKRERERGKGKGPDCMGCVQQQKKRVVGPNSIQRKEKKGRGKHSLRSQARMTRTRIR